MLWTQTYFDQAYYIEGKGFIRNPWRNNLADVPFPDKLKKAIVQVIEYSHPEPVKDADTLLDSMTYKAFLVDYVKVPSDVVDDVCAYFDKAFAAAGCYRSAWMSAYSATFLALPAVVNFGNPTPFFYNQPSSQASEEFKDIVRSGQFPGGNAHIARRFLKLIKPEVITGAFNFADVEYGTINWDKLDRAEDRYRLRLSATVFSVAHNDKPAQSSHVIVSYAKDGQMYSVRAKRVICAGQQHVNRRICADISPAVRDAMQAFHHQPVMVVNIALRHWRFLEKIGAASVRWFEGFGWFTSLHLSFELDGKSEALDPDEPVVVTLFVPFFAGSEQDSYDKVATASRMMMFGTPYSSVERAIRSQFTKMFGPYGFDASRDIAGIIVNRQGHAYTINPPGFHFSHGDKKSPLEVLREPYHRIAFGHSELHGHQAWNTATEQGKRAAEQMLTLAD
jgi:spermidine dehydrogenase